MAVYTDWTGALASVDTKEERRNLKLPFTFPAIKNPKAYPSRGVVARIKHQMDGTIRAEYKPGVANYSFWIARKIPWNRWRQTGEGIWLGTTVNAEEAHYIIELTKSNWSEGGEYEIYRDGKAPEEKSPAKMVPKSDPVEEIEFKCWKNSDQLMLFG